MVFSVVNEKYTEFIISIINPEFVNSVPDEFDLMAWYLIFSFQ